MYIYYYWQEAEHKLSYCQKPALSSLRLRDQRFISVYLKAFCHDVECAHTDRFEVAPLAPCNKIVFTVAFSTPECEFSVHTKFNFALDSTRLDSALHMQL